MNRTYRQAAAGFLMPLLALLSLFCITSFLHRIDFLVTAGQRLTCPYWAAAAIVALTSGIGLNVPFLLWWKRKYSWPLRLSCVFSLYFLALQFYLAIAPNLSSCNCTSYSETILGIKDWYVTEPALGLLAANVLLLWLARKPAVVETTDNRIVSV